MAQRYGGKYSPGAAGSLREAKKDARVRDAAGARSNIMFIPGIVALMTNIWDGPLAMVLGLLSAGAFFGGAALLREGLRAEAAFNLRKIAKRPSIPRKGFSAALTALGVAFGAFAGEAGLLASVIYGGCAAALHIAAFGLDPLRDKHVEGVDHFQQDRIARVVDEAEDYLEEITAHIAALKDRHLNKRVAAFTASAREMIAHVEEDPRDLTSARKFLSVYLMGARDATRKFAQLWERSGDAQARADYEALLSDLQGNFAAKSEKLLLTDRSDVDIEIKVLRDRLQREGLYQGDES